VAAGANVIPAIVALPLEAIALPRRIPIVLTSASAFA